MKHTIVALFLLFSASAMAGGYKLYHSEDGIEVYGKWKHEKAFKKGKLMLCLKVVNTKEESALLDFDVNFFETAMLSETIELKSLCIKAGGKLKGRKSGLCLLSESFSNEQLIDDGFHWLVDDLSIQAGTDCVNTQ